MKRAPIILAVLLVGGIIIYFAAAKSPSTSTSSTGGSPSNTTQRADAGTTQNSSTAPVVPPGVLNPATPAAKMPGAEDDEDLKNEDDRTATELYKTSEEALAAIKKGSADYDDLILEQFTELGENCTWCDSLYKSVKDLLNAPETTSDQKSYYAELLAVSGRVDNVQSLVDAVKGAKNQEEADLFAEALELTVGKDEVVKFLGSQLDTPNETLKEALVGAITNQGSLLAANLLYKNTVEKGDPDGYYSLGIGLGEFIPDEDALPFLQELVLKRDAYSHLAVKSLLNSGVSGVRLVFDALTNSKDPVFDKQMLKDAVDHVNYEDDIEQYLKKVVETSKQPLAVDFAKDILNDFNLQESDTSEASED